MAKEKKINPECISLSQVFHLGDIKMSLLPLNCICLCVSLNDTGTVIIWYRIKCCTTHQYYQRPAPKNVKSYIWTLGRASETVNE